MVTGEFDEEILRDLINEGYEGQALLAEFKRQRALVPAALEQMFADLLEKYDGKTYTMEEVFNDDDDENGVSRRISNQS